MKTELTILSAGAVKPGLTKVIEAYERDTRRQVGVSFATAPAIRKRFSEGECADIVIAPPNVLAELAGKLSNDPRVIVGRIGVGVLVRQSAPLPDVATVDQLKESLRSAGSVVYNQASTGMYLEALFERLGLGPELKAKSARYADFAAVLDHVSRGRGNEIGFGATTVIIENQSRGVRFAGPLPSGIQNYTQYAAAMTGTAGESAKDFMDYLASAAAKSLLAAAGID